LRGIGNVRYGTIAALVFFLKKNRKEKSNKIIAGNKITENDSISFGNITNNGIKNIREKANNIAVMT